MLRTTESRPAQKLCVDLPGLMSLLSCGRQSAEQVAEAAGAGVNIGRRRFYLVSKVEQYLVTLADQEKAAQ